MREKPVTRDEVRLDHDYHFIAVPADAFSPDPEVWWRVEPIPALWEPLVEQVIREQRAYIEGPRAEMLERWRSIGLATAWGERTIEPPTIPGVYRSNEVDCRQCGTAFYRRGKSVGHFCSDACVEKAAGPVRRRKVKRQVAKRATARSEARAGRACETCSEPIEAARSTRRFCSEKCRVAAHRAQRKSPPGGSRTATKERLSCH